MECRAILLAAALLGVVAFATFVHLELGAKGSPGIITASAVFFGSSAVIIALDPFPEHHIVPLSLAFCFLLLVVVAASA